MFLTMSVLMQSRYYSLGFNVYVPISLPPSPEETKMECLGQTLSVRNAFVCYPFFDIVLDVVYVNRHPTFDVRPYQRNFNN